VTAYAYTNDIKVEDIDELAKLILQVPELKHELGKLVVSLTQEAQEESSQEVIPEEEQDESLEISLQRAMSKELKAQEEGTEDEGYY